MNKTQDFLASSFFASGLSYSIGYLWFLMADMNWMNAILILGGLVWLCIGLIVGLVAGLVWTARHVRITIV